MEIDPLEVFTALFDTISTALDESFFFLVLKFFLFVYVAVLLVDIVLLLVLKGLSSDLKAALYGAERPLASKNTVIKRFEAARARLRSSNPSQYKVAILEVDALADEILDGIGFKGATMKEKLDDVKGGQLENKELLVHAHEVRNQIVHDPKFTLSEEEAERYFGNYEKFFQEVELL